MRDFEFRGKSVQTGEWLYGDLERRRVNGRTFIHTYYDNGTYNRSCEVVPETVGQFTGLKDKNTNRHRIFDGDIIYAECQDKSEGRFLVGWNNEAASFGLMDEYSYRSLSEGYDFSEFQNLVLLNLLQDAVIFEVIGNIHDNSELLTNVS